MANSLPDHIEWLLSNYRGQLQKALDREQVVLSVNEAISVMMDADPSDKKKAVDWLVKAYITNGFLWEDISSGTQSRAYQTLKLFAQFRGNLPSETRNLYQYSRLGDLYAAVQSFIPLKISGKQEKKNFREKILSDSILLHRDENLILAVPLTQEAAVWWGRGTQWCTAAVENTNYFNRYNKTAPLFISVFPRGFRKENNNPGIARKFQMWFCDGDVQFMDENDNPVAISLVHDNWLDFQPLIEWYLNQGAPVLKWMPEEYRTLEACKVGLTNHALEILWVPKEFIMKEHCLNAVKYQTDILSKLSYLVDQETFIKAFNINPGIIHYIPDHLKCYEIYLAVASKTPDIFCNIPKHLITNEICMVYINEYPEYIGEIPEEFITKKIINISLANNLYNIRSIPQALISEEYLLELIDNYPKIASVFYSIWWNDKTAWTVLKKEPTNLLYIPRRLVTQEMCDLAIQQNPAASLGFPDRFHTANTLKIAVEHGLLIKEISEELQKLLTPDDWLIAIQKSEENVYWMDKEKFSDTNLLYAAIEILPEWINQVPERFVTQELCKQAVSLSAVCIDRIPLNRLNRELCILAAESSCFVSYKKAPHIFAAREDIGFYRLNESGSNLEYVNPDILDRNACLQAVSNYGRAIEWVPDHLKDREVILTAVNSDSQAYFYLNKSDITSEITLACMEKYPENLTKIVRFELELTPNVILKGIGFAAEKLESHLFDTLVERILRLKRNDLRLIADINSFINDEIKINEPNWNKTMFDNFNNYLPASSGMVLK